MKPLSRIFWLIALMFFTAGCSGYRTICQTSSNPPRIFGTTPQEPCNIEQGDLVRLTLIDGELVEGTVELISAQEIVLDPAGGSLQPRGYSPDQIQTIERLYRGLYRPGTVLVIVGGVLVISGIVLAVIASQMSFMGD